MKARSDMTKVTEGGFQGANFLKYKRNNQILKGIKIEKGLLNSFVNFYAFSEK